MTNEEAIKDLKNLLELHDAVGFADSEIDALKMAIDALEKQIPKKVMVYEEKKFRGVFWYKCPKCGEPFYTEEVQLQVKYCSCGQRLNWSGAEE